VTQLIIFQVRTPMNPGCVLFAANIPKEEMAEVRAMQIEVLLCNGWKPLAGQIHLLPTGGPQIPGNMSVMPMPFIFLTREVDAPKARPTLQLPSEVV